MTSTLTFTTIEPAHLEGALKLSKDVSWPHRLEDWAFVHGFSHGVVGLEGDRVVATALATSYGPIGMVNLIIVDHALRGRGLGRSIMSRAMDTISPAAWRLVATQEGLPLYEKLGFVATGEVVQHQGQLSQVTPQGDAVWATPQDMASIMRLDEDATDMSRQPLYKALASTARFAVLRPGGTVTGFAAVRPFGRGEVIGPVLANSLEEAKSLISLIAAERTGAFMRIDTDTQSGLAPWLTELGMPYAGGGITMQKGTAPATPTGTQRIFALASQALG